MDELNRFEQLVVIALSNVSQLYYSTVYKNIESFKVALYGRQGRFVENDFERYGERVFCYEFYHQLRNLIVNERILNPDFLLEAELQGEVDKFQIMGLIDRFGLTSLSREFIPDFLMHSPGNANNHPYVIEVKCTGNLTPRAVLKDLEKINEFITRYSYQRGLFITINSNVDEIVELLKSLSRRIDSMEGKDRIKVIQKDNQDSGCNIIQLPWLTFQE
jgi:hypothetical protein